MTAESATHHATTVAIDGRAVMIDGPSGVGKSDLALRLIDRGAMLVSDDYTRLSVTDGQLIASPPATIAGRMEVRGIGILAMPHVAAAPVALRVSLEPVEPRMPEAETSLILGIAIPHRILSPLPASAPIKVEWALRESRAA